jgi:pyruvate/2-oxoglutarate dehydrogenase complex dihydrolipoamide acyltransferase (E2) component
MSQEEIAKLLAEAANVAETQTLKTDDLVGKQFTLLDVRAVEGKYGETWVGTIDLQGQTVDAWLNGAVVARQLNAIKSHLPLTVSMMRNKDKFGEPFELVL